MMEKDGIDMPASDPFDLQSLKLSLGADTNKNSVEKVKTMHEKFFSNFLSNKFPIILDDEVQKVSAFLFNSGH